MAAKITRANFGELLQPIHKKMYLEELKAQPLGYRQIFMSAPMEKFEESYQHLGGLNKWKKNTEGSQINEDEPTQGPTAYMIPDRYDNGYTVTWEMVRDDLYGVFKKGKGLDGDARGLGRGLGQSLDLSAMKVLEDGFTVAGYDTVPLFSASHPIPGKTILGDNLVTGALTPATLKAAITKLRNQIGDDGIKAVVNPTHLVVPVDLEWKAKEILQSVKQAYEESNTANVLPDLKITCLPYLGDQLGSHTMWYVMDKNVAELRLDFRDYPQFDSQPLPKTIDRFYFGFAAWAVGYTAWQGIVGSLGSS